MLLSKRDEIIKITSLSLQLNQCPSGAASMPSNEHREKEYIDAENYIDVGLQYINEEARNQLLSKSREALAFKEKLLSLSNNERLAIAINPFIRDLKDPVGNTLKTYFYTKMRGDCPKLAKLGVSMLKNLADGITLICTIDEWKMGWWDRFWGRPVASREFYTNLYHTCQRNVIDEIQSCKNSIEENLLRDMEDEMKKDGKTAESIADILGVKFREKYDWLQFFILIYSANSSHLDSMHAHEGSRVGTCNINGWCGATFYQLKSEMSLFSEQVMTTRDTVRSIIANEASNSTSPKLAIDNVSSKLNRMNIGWWGIHCVGETARIMIGYSFTQFFVNNYEETSGAMKCAVKLRIVVLLK